jgi:hypothetical protein
MGPTKGKYKCKKHSPNVYKKIKRLFMNKWSTIRLLNIKQDLQRFPAKTTAITRQLWEY